MRAPPNFILALLTLAISGAYAAEPQAANATVGGVIDGSGQPVRDGFGDCWGTGFTRPNAAACANLSERSAAVPAAPAGASSATRSESASPESSAMAGTSESYGSSAAATPATAPVSAAGNPGYVTDSNGFVVRGSQGECWHTSNWTPALATVVGCDGVLAKAVPVPAPAPSPKPAPTEPSAQMAPEAAPAPVKPEAESPAPPLVAPSGTPPAAANAAPKGGEAPPVVVPPSTPSPPAAEIAPQGTEAGAAQPASEKVTLDTDTYFDFDKATLKPEGKRKLQELAQRLSSVNLEVVVATGHTDWTGTDAYNQKLSERRASTVKHFLVEQGLPGNRIFTEGKGERQPIATNHTREGRAKNRRVDVELVGKRGR